MATLSNAQLAQRVESLVAAWNTREAEFRAWHGGTATGGPNSDGYYPLTDKEGVTVLAPSPAKLVDMVTGPMSESVSHRDAALQAAQAVEDMLAEVERLTGNAEAHENTSRLYRDQAELAKAGAEAAEANASVYATRAQNAADSAEDDADDAAAFAADAQYHSAWAENWAIDAAASAANAGNYDPSQYATKANGLTDIVGLQAALNARALATDLTSLQGTVSSLQSAVNARALQSDLTALQTTVNGKLTSAADQWLLDANGHPRFWLGTSGSNIGTTYIRGSGITFRSSSDATIGYFDNSGKLYAAGDIYQGSGTWFRVRGNNCGIHWEDWGGGWFMNDSSWMRLYGSKSLYVQNQIYGTGLIRTDSHFQVGDVRQPVFRSGTAAPSGGSDGDIYFQYS